MYGYLMGLITCLFVWAVSAVVWDDNYEYTKSMMQKAEVTCRSVNSTPFSYDLEEVTCANKATLPFLVGVK